MFYNYLKIIMKFTLYILSSLLLFGCATQQENKVTTSQRIVVPNSNNVMSIPIIADDGVLFKKSSIAGYQLTEADRALIAAPNRPVSISTYQSESGELLSLPSFKMRKIFKSGETDDGFNWSIAIEELSVNVFKISGTNSKGLKINEHCYDLSECFQKL